MYAKNLLLSTGVSLCFIACGGGSSSTANKSPSDDSTPSTNLTLEGLEIYSFNLDFKNGERHYNTDKIDPSNSTILKTTEKPIITLQSLQNR